MAETLGGSDPTDLAGNLLPNLIDQIAQDEPDAIYAEYSISSTSYSAGFRSITYAQLANAINGVASWIETRFGRSESFETLAYLGPNDARYVFAFVAAMKAGYKLFLISPRNSVAAHLSLFNNTECTKIITTKPQPPVIGQILAQEEIPVFHIHSLETLLSTQYAHYPYAETLSTARNDAAFVSHTSGSTGIPKPRVYTNDFISRAVRNTLLSPPEGYVSLQRLVHRKRLVLLLPFFHPAGVQFGILNAVYNRTTIILPPASAPPNADVLLEMLKDIKANAAVMAPFTIEALAKDSHLLDEVATRLKLIIFGGGSLPQGLGDIVAAKIKLASFLGSSETAGYPAIFPAGSNHAKDWNFIQIHPAAGAEFEQWSTQGFELVLKRSVIAEPYQPIFALFPELQEYKTKDLFTPHPTLPSMWMHASRADDIVVFLNGEKTNPVTFEGHVSKHPAVSAALVFGNQRFEAGLLIQLMSQEQFTTTERARWIEKLWPIIDEANFDAPSHAQISQSHICFTDPGRPVLRTGKGTVQRQATLDLYAEKIDLLYTDVEKAWALPAEHVQNVDLKDDKSLTGIIRESLTSIIKKDQIGLEDDFFERGVDSLQVLHLVRELRSRLGVDHLQPATVYLNPSIASLAKAISTLDRKLRQSREQQELDQKTRITKALEEHVEQLEQQLERLSELGPPKERTSHIVYGEQVVILTGSTGSIGSYILKALMECQDVSYIYCLNRTPDSATKQRIRNAKVDPTLPIEFSAERVQFLETDLSHSTFGLTPEVYQKLSESATAIMHNAWPVDFNLSLKSFRKQLVGVVNLCVFSVCCKRRPTLLFLSSVSAIIKKASTLSHVSETFMDDPSSPAPAGYAESKFIAESLLALAAVKLQLDVRIARLGQVTGAVRSPGKWSSAEWIPSLILSSRSLGAIPDSLGNYGRDEEDINWIPVDVLADVIIDLGLRHIERQSTAEVKVFHVLNPFRTSWPSLVPTIIDTLNSFQRNEAKELPRRTLIHEVSTSEWLEKLRTSAPDRSMDADIALAVNPALKLIEFFTGKLAENTVPIWDTGEAEAMSVSLRKLGAIKNEDMQRWVQSWCEKS